MMGKGFSMGAPSLKLRFILVVSALVLLSGAVVAGVAGYHYGNSLEKAALARAQGIALGLSLQTADYVLINDRISIQRLLESEARGNPDIAYIFLVRDGDILGHTFDRGVPEGLLTKDFQTPAGRQATRNVVSATGEQFLDIAQPIFNDKAGVIRLGVNKAQYLGQIRHLWFEIGLLTLLVLAASVGLCLLFAKRIARPLENLVQAIKGISAGDLTARMPPGGGMGEVDQLADSFNAMATRIATYTGRLQDQAAELEHAQQQARISCGIIQEVGGLSTPREIGEHLASRLRQFLRCRETHLVLGGGGGSQLFQISDNSVKVRKIKNSLTSLLGDLGDNFERRYILASQSKAAVFFDAIGPFARAGLVPIHNQGRLLGALISVCISQEGCEECEIGLAEKILQQASGSILRARKHDEEKSRMLSEKEQDGLPGLVGKSPKMASLYHLIRDVAPTDSTVLLLGESGTGKEVVARAIHQESPRHGKPFVVIDCAAYPATLLESEIFGHEKGAFTGALRRKKGRFEQAHGGTVFLDEIGEIPLSAQVKLLRVLQTQQIERLGGEETKNLDVRILAATNQDLVELVKQDRFREDLYYRLKVFPITLPPLRDRINDVPRLARHFLARFNGEHGKDIDDFSDEAMRIMLDYSWPGNVRELENLVERSLILAKGKRIHPWDLPKDMRDNRPPAPMSLENQEKTALETVLEQCSWNKKKAAKRLGISRTTLYRKIKKHSLAEPTRH